MPELELEQQQTVRLLTLEQAYTLLRISKKHFHSMVRPTLPVIKIGRRILVEKQNLDRWIENRTCITNTGAEEEWMDEEEEKQKIRKDKGHVI